MNDKCDVCGCEIDSEGLCENHCYCENCGEQTEYGR